MHCSLTNNNIYRLYTEKPLVYIKESDKIGKFKIITLNLLNLTIYIISFIHLPVC